MLALPPAASEGSFPHPYGVLLRTVFDAADRQPATTLSFPRTLSVDLYSLPYGYFPLALQDSRQGVMPCTPIWPIQLLAKYVFVTSHVS
jgi:hypothetical protein